MVGYFLSNKEIAHFAFRSRVLLWQTFQKVILEYWFAFLLLRVLYFFCLVGLGQNYFNGSSLRWTNYLLLLVYDLSYWLISLFHRPHRYDIYWLKKLWLHFLFLRSELQSNLWLFDLGWSFIKLSPFDRGVRLSIQEIPELNFTYFFRLRLSSDEYVTSC